MIPSEAVVESSLLFWRNPDIKLSRFFAGFLMIPIGILIAMVYLFLVFHAIPVVPPSILFYSILHYLVYLFIIPITVATMFTRISGLYTRTMLFNIISTIIISYTLCIILYQGISCQLGNLPMDCRDLLIQQAALGIITGLIWLLQVICLILISYISINAARLTQLKQIIT